MGDIQRMAMFHEHSQLECPIFSNEPKRPKKFDSRASVRVNAIGLEQFLSLHEPLLFGPTCTKWYRDKWWIKPKKSDDWWCSHQKWYLNRVCLAFYCHFHGKHMRFFSHWLLVLGQSWRAGTNEATNGSERYGFDDGNQEVWLWIIMVNNG